MRTILWRLQSVSAAVSDLIRALSGRRVGRLFVVVPALILIAALLALVTSSGVLAPFLYPLF